MENKLRVLICSPEVVPFAKTGGLADVAGALPLALERLGVEVRVAMPGYKSVRRLSLTVHRESPKVSYVKMGKDIPVYFIENDEYFGRKGLYGDKEGDYPDNLDRFTFYCRETLELLRQIDFRPDVIHCNDWQTGLIPLYFKTIYRDVSFYKGIKTLFTVHNLAYQGLFPKEQLPKTGLEWDVFTIKGLEYYDKISLIKGGLIFATLINTVSPTYSKEIQTPGFGCGLEGVLYKRRDDLYGIINGVDYNVWNPATDEVIAKRYTLKTIKDKYINKEKLQVEIRLDRRKEIPLIGLIQRLADQKGLDLVASAVDEMLGLGLQLILLGIGDQKYHIMFKKIERKYPGRISINLKYDSDLSHKIYAGCDIFLMPSRYEPCGLGQIISLKYGTIPIVRKTGGLADTIRDYDPRAGTGNGFVFSSYSSSELLETLKRAISVYRQKRAWRKLVKQAMEADFSWDQSARSYVELYRKAINR